MKNLFPLLIAALVAASHSNAADLGTHPEWLALLHYEPGSTRSSFVDDPDFFFAPDGAGNPAAELTATLQAFRLPADSGDRHAICRFPARLAWLEAQGLLRRDELPAPACAEFDGWRSRLDPHSVTLVFASAYLNSPSSMYGHTLLRIDPPEQQGDSFWLSWAVNFGAYIPEGDNSIAYAWRGLAGGYPGLFAVQPYYERIQKYARLENRDLWEYRLDFTPAETGRLVDHLWELRDINFDYYFLDENCSYRLLELLEVARPGLRLAERFPAWVIPIDTVRIVEDAGLVVARDWRPAHATFLDYYVNQLAPAQKTLAADIAEGGTPPDAPALTDLAPAAQRTVLLAAYRLLRFRHDRAARDAQVAKRSHALLRAISRLPSGEEGAPVRPAAPEDGHLSARAAAGFGYRDGTPRRLLELRGAYHDLQDSRAGYRDGAAITMGRIRLAQPSGGSPEVEEAEVLSIESVSPRDRFFRPLSWQVHTGWQRIHEQDDSELAPYVDAGGGIAWPVLGGTGALMATGRIEYLSRRARNLDLAPGVQAEWLRGWRLGTFHVRLGLQEFTGGSDRFDAAVVQQVELGRNLALRLRGGRSLENGHGATRWDMVLQHYF